MFMCAEACRGQKRVLEPLELELIEVVSHLAVSTLLFFLKQKQKTLVFQKREPYKMWPSVFDTFSSVLDIFS